MLDSSVGPMRIAHVTNFFMPRFGYQEAYLPPAQAALGHDVHLVCADRYSKRQVPPPPLTRIVGAGESDHQGVHVYRLPVSVEIGVRLVIMAGLADTLRRIRPDVVHCHGILLPAALTVARLKAELGYRLIYDDHCAHFNTDATSTWWRRLAHRFLRAFYMPRIRAAADRFTVIGEPERDFSVEVFGLPADALPIIRLGADLAAFHPDAGARRTARAELGLTERDVAFLCAGKLDRGKDVPQLIQAFAQVVARRGDAVTLFLVGSASEAEMAGYRALVDELAIAERVRFLPMQDQAGLVRLARACDVGVWPGNATATYIEAMACGLPLVVPVTSYTDAVAPAAVARRFPRGDVAALSGVMDGLASDRALREELARGAAAFVEAELSWSAIARQYLELYVR